MNDSSAPIIIEEAPLVLDPTNPMRSARAFVDMTCTNDEGLRTLHRHRETFWQWTGSYYRLINDEGISALVWKFLEEAKQEKKNADDEIFLVPFKPTRAKVGDVVAALTAVTQLDSNLEPPLWLTRSDSMPAADELFACGNGLLHLPTGELHQPSPDYFNVCASEVLYDPKAEQPTKWLEFMDQLFPNDKEAQQLQQEWFGYLLSPDTSQQKMLLDYGPRRAGKGTKARILRMLLGSASVASPNMGDLSQHFGLESLINKSLAIISDARIGKHTDRSLIVERFLTISGEDSPMVARKFKPAWHGKLPTRMMIITSEIPTLSEGSGALAGRLLILVMTRSFYGEEDPMLTNKLAKESSGILNWSIKGYRSLRERGHFVQPKSSERIAVEIELLAAPVKAFINDCCEVGSGFEVKVDALWISYQNWCTGQGTRHGDKRWFGRNLHAAVPGLTISRPLDGGGQRTPTYVGLRLADGAAAAQEAEAAAQAARDQQAARAQREQEPF